MIETNKDFNKSEKGIFRIFEWFTESIGWLQIVMSPLILGLVIGAVVYFSRPTTIRLVTGIVIAIAGLVIGIIWANKQWRGKGTIWFISRIIATPELDNTEEEKDKTITTSHEAKKGNR